MEQELTIDSAQEYVLKHLTDLGYEDVRITSAHESTLEGEKFIVILFAYRSEPEDYEGQFDVWLQDGQIYGEW